MAKINEVLTLMNLYLDNSVAENKLRPLATKLGITKGTLIRMLIEVGLNHQDEVEALMEDS